MNEQYIFKSDRLGFRNWTTKDEAEFAKMNADAEVMEHFPKPLNQQESIKLIARFQDHYKKHGYTYFSTEVLDTGEWIGFIGLAYQDYIAEFTPATDIGWRLKKSAWGKGYATEGAIRCLAFGFKNINLERIVAVCTTTNKKSENVMKKIGMFKKDKFKHPGLKEFPKLETCIWYEIHKSEWQHGNI